MPGIGLLNEKSLHASLKQWYAKPHDLIEETVDGFVIDIVRDNLLIEIQTGTFAAIKPKLIRLARNHQVRLIYPIAREKWIVKPDADKPETMSRRRSPKRGRIEDLFHQLVSFPHLMKNPNFSIEVLLITEEESRRFNGVRRWRKKGWETEERRLLEVVDRQVFETPQDLHRFLPIKMNMPFTTKDLAESLGIRRDLAQKMAYCLRKTDTIQCIGKQQRSSLYKAA